MAYQRHNTLEIRVQSHRNNTQFSTNSIREEEQWKAVRAGRYRKDYPNPLQRAAAAATSRRRKCAKPHLPPLAFPSQHVPAGERGKEELPLPHPRPAWLRANACLLPSRFKLVFAAAHHARHRLRNPAPSSLPLYSMLSGRPPRLAGALRAIDALLSAIPTR
jgi:hypothetical protein